MSGIFNGASQMVALGENDKSARTAPRLTSPNPIHYPMFWLFTQRGEAKEVTIEEGDLPSIYGARSFEVDSPYYTHASLFAAAAYADGNKMRVRRLIPDDAGPIANAFVSVEVLTHEQPDYERNSDGSIKYVTGSPVEKVGAPILKTDLVFRITHHDGTGEDKFGVRAIAPGTMTGTVDGEPVTSEIIPLFDIKESSIGSDGNLTGFSFFAPRAGDRSEQIDPSVIEKNKAYPFIFKLLRAANADSTPQPTLTLDGQQSVTFVWPNGARHHRTNRQISFGERLVPNYRRMNDLNLKDIPGFVSDSHVYSSNLDTLLKRLAAAEKAYVDADLTGVVETDFTGAADEHNRFNFLSATTYSGYPYHTARVLPNEDGFRPSANNYVMFKGGFDGTMNNVTLETLTGIQLDRFLTERDPLTSNDAVHRFSALWDSGYTREIKNKLLQVQAFRKDVCVYLACYEDSANASNVLMTPADYNAYAVTLKTTALLYPASTWFSTGNSKTSIQGGSGIVIGSDWKRRTTLNYELLRKFCRYAGGYALRGEKNITAYPGHLVEFMKEIDQTWASVDQRTEDWNVGLNQVMNYSGENDAYFPQYIGVFEDDTSVLKNMITNLCLTSVWKVCQDVHRDFSFTDKLTKLQIKERVEREMSRRLAGRYDDRLLIEVEVVFTEEDMQRNYSWTVIARVGAKGAHTVMTAMIETYRWEDLVNRINGGV